MHPVQYVLHCVLVGSLGLVDVERKLIDNSYYVLSRQSVNHLCVRRSFRRTAINIGPLCLYDIAILDIKSSEGLVGGLYAKWLLSPLMPLLGDATI